MYPTKTVRGRVRDGPPWCQEGAHHKRSAGLEPSGRRVLALNGGISNLPLDLPPRCGGRESNPPVLHRPDPLHPRPLERRLDGTFRQDGRIRTSDPLVPNQVPYQTGPHPVGAGAMANVGLDATRCLFVTRRLMIPKPVPSPKGNTGNHSQPSVSSYAVQHESPGSPAVPWPESDIPCSPYQPYTLHSLSSPASAHTHP